MADGITRFLDLRTTTRQTRIGDGGWDTCASLTAALDDAVGELAAPIADESVAIVAVGGYGRREMCLFSDVDVMILHRDAELKSLIDAVLYPLWDANLKVGHSVRTIKEAVAVAKDDFDTLTSLLTMRCLAGDAVLVTELEHALIPTVRKPMGPALVARERERRDLDPYPVMSADLKEGRGGLRTYQAELWEARRQEIAFDGDRTDEERRSHYGALLAARNALHAAAGRAMDRFHSDLRVPAARWLGVDVASLAGDVCAALHAGDRIAERAQPELLDEGAPAEVGQRVRRWTLRRRHGARVPEAPPGSIVPPLHIALRLASLPRSEWPGSDEAALRSAAWRSSAWQDADRDALVDVLSAGARGRATWALLDEMGWMSNHLPEWAVVRTRPQLAPFHDHPVGAHLWRTVDEILAAAQEPADDLAGIASEVGSKDLLVLAAFFHDLGKGHGGDHSEIGAELAERILRRFGFDAATVSTVASLTRHHLLLSETAARRDLDDPKVIADLAAKVGDATTLKVLYLLSIADAQATGSAMLNQWKATLLRTAFIRVAAALGESGATQDERLAAAIGAAGTRHRSEDVEWHVSAMDDSYLLSNTPEEIAWHLDSLADMRKSREEAPHIAVRDADHGSKVAVLAEDRTGLLGAIATVFAVHGISILGARLSTRADGIAFDVFDVEDDSTHTAVPDDRWIRVRADLAGAAGVSPELGEALERRARAYGGDSGLGDVSVRAPSASVAHTVLEVRCGDRIGRLAQIVSALYDEGLDIRVAKLDTRAGQVVDTFYVTRNGKRIGNTDEIHRTVTAIRDRLRKER